MPSVFAAFVSLGSIIALRLAWSGTRHASISKKIGWAGLFVSLILWSLAEGGDRGVAVGLVAMVIAAIVTLGFEALRQNYFETDQNRSRKANSKQRRNSRATDKPTSITKTLSILTTMLVSGIAAYGIAIGVHEIAWSYGMHASNALVIALFAFPILWSVFLSYFLVGRQITVKAVLLLGSLTCGFAVFKAGGIL